MMTNPVNTITATEVLARLNERAEKFDEWFRGLQPEERMYVVALIQTASLNEGFDLLPDIVKATMGAEDEK